MTASDDRRYGWVLLGKKVQRVIYTYELPGGGFTDVDAISYSQDKSPFPAGVQAHCVGELGRFVSSHRGAT